MWITHTLLCYSCDWVCMCINIQSEYNMLGSITSMPNIQKLPFNLFAINIIVHTTYIHTIVFYTHEFICINTHYIAIRWITHKFCNNTTIFVYCWCSTLSPSINGPILRPSKMKYKISQPLLYYWQRPKSDCDLPYTYFKA